MGHLMGKHKGNLIFVSPTQLHKCSAYKYKSTRQAKSLGRGTFDGFKAERTDLVRDVFSQTRTYFIQEFCGFSVRIAAQTASDVVSHIPTYFVLGLDGLSLAISGRLPEPFSFADARASDLTQFVKQLAHGQYTQGLVG
jgi:hypothetical protein